MLSWLIARLRRFILCEMGGPHQHPRRWTEFHVSDIFADSIHFVTYCRDCGWPLEFGITSAEELEDESYCCNREP
jgi:hypothetical protein